MTTIDAVIPVPDEMTAAPPGEKGIWPCGCRAHWEARVMTFCRLHRHAGRMYSALTGYLQDRNEESRLHLRWALKRIAGKPEIE
jgi:hypothetical protein